MMHGMSTRAGVFLITLSGLIFEIGLTRIYSATIWYHFAFVAISVALLGWGLGGLAVHLLKHVWKPTLEKAAGLTMAYGVAIPICLAVLVKYPFQLDRLPLYFVTPLVPFFLAGMALSIVFDLHRAIAGKLYFADLLGASIGAVTISLLLQIMGGEAAVLVAAIAPMVATACLSKKLRLAGGIAAVVLAIAALSNGRTGLFHVIPGTIKAERRQMDEHPGSFVAQSGWNAYSRIDAVEGVAAPYVARLYIDSDAWTSIYPWDGNIASVPELKSSYRALPFTFTPGGHTLVIGPGGGTDVLAALASGMRKVTAVELNPLMITFVRHYGAKAGNIYDRPDVDVIQSEGRNFISRTGQTFDTIFLGFVDSWASVASGGLSLSENYLYTTEAFKAYYDHLTDNGTLVILRWDLDIPRLVSNTVALVGADAASTHMAVLIERRPGAKDNPPQMLFMLHKQPFSADQIHAMTTSWAEANPFIVPGHPAPKPYDDLLSGRTPMAQYVAESPALVGPVFDDSPFYFATERPWGMPPTIARGLFYSLLLPALVLLVLFAIFGKPRGQRAAPYAASIVYFAALGFGFIAVELSLLQNLTLLLGHPIFTLSVLLFTLLAAGGVGSAISRRVSIRTACLVVWLLGDAEALALPKLVPMLLPLGLWTRVALAILFIAPLGLAMGMPFPRGLEQTGRGSLPAPPFYWGLNGTMSVISSVTTVFVALTLGFRTAMEIGSACYLLAAIVSKTALET
jgi:hypothetical protein